MLFAWSIEGDVNINRAAIRTLATNLHGSILGWCSCLKRKPLATAKTDLSREKKLVPKKIIYLIQKDKIK